ncbi:Hypothetical protein SMAX5B_019154 [Scophthalmus maximus]|uniref:Uncharacterized protein n=1 Tax=Scophthalmus maximus TaxID=52904 RepID=A0A2U9C7W9_SCOMX|nr:Hypothetical protein SMAX5B_019154 [Scophthalmus maximus]
MSTLWPFCSLPHVIRSSFSSLQRNKLCFHEKVPAGLGSPEAHRLVTESLAPERRHVDMSNIEIMKLSSKFLNSIWLFQHQGPWPFFTLRSELAATPERSGAAVSCTRLCRTLTNVLCEKKRGPLS